MAEMTNEEIREFNLWLFDNPRYQTLSWREQVAAFYLEKYRKEGGVMFDFGDRIIRYLVGKALIGIGLIAVIVSLILSADVAAIASICAIVVGAILALEAA